MERSVLITCSATPPASPVRGCGARASVVDEVVEVCESKNDTERWRRPALLINDQGLQ